MQNAAAPKVSVGLPVYNGADFLRPTLGSILGQTYDDLEVVISDNGSTDATEAICRDLAAQDGRVRYLRAGENRGAAWNYQNVFWQSRGPYFKWAAHDDLLAPTYLERCVEVLDSTSESVTVVYPRTQLVDGNGEVVRDYDDNLDLRQPEPHERLRALVRNVELSNAAFGLMRRSALLRTRLLDSFPSADYVMLAELALLGEFHEIPDRLFFRRMHEGMSREANATSEAVAEWFEPGSGRKRRLEFTRLLVEFLRAIARMPLAPAERARCFAVFLNTWSRRDGVHVIEELFRVEWVEGYRFRRQRAGRR